MTHLPDDRTIGLALGGGGARGFAHVGVLRAVRELDLHPTTKAGTSMGGLLGAMAAGGYSPNDILGIMHDRSLPRTPLAGAPRRPAARRPRHRWRARCSGRRLGAAQS